MPSIKKINGTTVRRLRWLMTIFFIAMAVPTAVLVYKAYSQLEWEAYYQHRQLAEELANRINQQLNAYVAEENERSFSDYGFIVVEGDNTNNYVARSPLSNYPTESNFPGIVGYFQIDANGEFSTPLLPESIALTTNYGISAADLQARISAQSEIEAILSSNRLVVNRDVANVVTGRERTVESANIVDKLVDSLGRQVSRRASIADANNGSQSEVGQVLEEEIPAAKTNTENFASQAAFDKLTTDTRNSSQSKSSSQAAVTTSTKTEESKLVSPYQEQIIKRENEMRAKERFQSPSPKSADIRSEGQSDLAIEKQKKISLEPAIVSDSVEEAVATDQTNIQIFKSEIDPLEVSLLESGHLVLYRNVWREGKRYIQGLLVEPMPFIQTTFENIFQSSLLVNMSELALVYQGKVLSAYGNNSRSYRLQSSSELSGTLLYRTRMSAPFSDLESVFTIRHLPAGPGGTVILWAALILAMVLISGVYLLYRMSLRNLLLVNQQQDFVSAVSHELKTPLTSIRMYGEMLKSGWADEDKKKGYYDFIFDESERLTRLINNVLALARMTRNETQVELKPITIGELMDIIRSKVDTQVKQAGFELNVSIHDQATAKTLELDTDIFSQIIINLVDNAIKFSAKSDKNVIDISVDFQSNGDACFAIRDYGPGIAKNQLKKIFELFYRSESELSRETTGTGIGLALVNQLTQTMNGKIDVVNSKPGAEFRLYFRCLN